MILTKSLKKLDLYTRQLWREVGQQSGSMDLTYSEGMYLSDLTSAPQGLRLTDLAQRMKVSKASASAMTTKLEKRGYLRRIPCPEDGRATFLQVTEKSLALEEEDEMVYIRTAKTFQESLDAAEYQDLCRLMAKACSGIKKDGVVKSHQSY